MWEKFGEKKRNSLHITHNVYGNGSVEMDDCSLSLVQCFFFQTLFKCDAIKRTNMISLDDTNG